MPHLTALNRLLAHAHDGGRYNVGRGEGTPIVEAAWIMSAAVVSAAKTMDGLQFHHLVAHGADDAPAAGRGAAAMVRRRRASPSAAQ